MPSDVEIRLAAPGDEARRDAFVEAHPDGSFFHLSTWTKVVQRVFWHLPQDLVALRGGEVVGVLPLMRTPGVIGRGNLVSTPYAVYGGALGADREVEEALVGAARTEADARRVGHLELRYRRDPGLDLRGSELYHTFVRDLPEAEEDVLKRMPKKARAEARKARNRHGLELGEGTWYVDDLYRMFLANKHGLGSPALPLRLFHELVTAAPGRVFVHLVRKGREPLAAVMSFGFRDTLTAYYSGTAEGADRAYSASNFMYMALQEWAVRRGYREFDFGRSRGDAGAFQFKVHQGFEPAPLHYRYHLVASRGLPTFNPSNPKTAILQKAWRRLPRFAAARLSDRLARYLP